MLRIYAYRRANGTLGTITAASAKAVRTYLTYQHGAAVGDPMAASVRVATLPEVSALLAHSTRLGKLKTNGREYAPNDAQPSDFIDSSRLPS